MVQRAKQMREAANTGSQFTRGDTVNCSRTGEAGARRMRGRRAARAPVRPRQASLTQGDNRCQTLLREGAGGIATHTLPQGSRFCAIFQGVSFDLTDVCRQSAGSRAGRMPVHAARTPSGPCDHPVYKVARIHHGGPGGEPIRAPTA